MAVRVVIGPQRHPQVPERPAARAAAAGRCRSETSGVREAAGGPAVAQRGRLDQVKPTFKTKCPSLRLSTAPPAQCTMNASMMMAKIATTTQKKNTTTPGTAYPATVLALAALTLATATSYPLPPNLFGDD